MGSRALLTIIILFLSVMVSPIWAEEPLTSNPVTCSSGFLPIPLGQAWTQPAQKKGVLTVDAHQKAIFFYPSKRHQRPTRISDLESLDSVLAKGSHDSVIQLLKAVLFMDGALWEDRGVLRRLTGAEEIDLKQREMILTQLSLLEQKKGLDLLDHHEDVTIFIDLTKLFEPGKNIIHLADGPETVVLARVTLIPGYNKASFSYHINYFDLDYVRVFFDEVIPESPEGEEILELPDHRHESKHDRDSPKGSGWVGM